MCLSATTEQVRSRVEAEGPPRISRRALLLGGAAVAAATTLPVPALARTQTAAPRGRLQDLTHVFRPGFPVYTGEPPKRRTLVTIQDDGFYAQEWRFAEHSATHLDVPGHFVSGARLADEIRPRELTMVPSAVIDISERAATDPDATVTLADVQAYEAAHGAIPPRAVVSMFSGWERFARDADAYRNPGADGLFHFPGWDVEAVDWLIENRDVQGIGVDTLSLDPGNSTTFDVHYRLLGADRYGIENLANLRKIPPAGTSLFVGLVPWKRGSGGPARVIASW